VSEKGAVVPCLGPLLFASHPCPGLTSVCHRLLSGQSKIDLKIQNLFFQAVLCLGSSCSPTSTSDDAGQAAGTCGQQLEGTGAARSSDFSHQQHVCGLRSFPASGKEALDKIRSCEEAKGAEVVKCPKRLTENMVQDKSNVAESSHL